MQHDGNSPATYREKKDLKQQIRQGLNTMFMLTDTLHSVHTTVELLYLNTISILIFKGELNPENNMA